MMTKTAKIRLFILIVLILVCISVVFFLLPKEKPIKSIHGIPPEPTDEHIIFQYPDDAWGWISLPTALQGCTVKNLIIEKDKGQYGIEISLKSARGRYPEKGELVTSPIEANCNFNLVTIDDWQYKDINPPANDISVKFRFSHDMKKWTEWQEPLHGYYPGNPGEDDSDEGLGIVKIYKEIVLHNFFKYFQCQFIFSSDGIKTPVLEKFAVNYYDSTRKKEIEIEP